MAGIGEIIKQVQNTVDFFTGEAAGKRGALYPDLSLITNTIKGKNWKLSLPYSFKVINNNRPLKPESAAEGYSEFKLHINPSDLQQDEQFSILITPTQGGIVVEHNGIIFKTLIISGTTGLHPFKGVGGAQSSGKVIAGRSDLRTGYEHFQELRNYFRAYAEEKKNKLELRLLFINRKDNEVFIVEPESFSLKRSASRGFLYDYTIQMRVLGAVEAEQTIADPLPGMFQDFDNVISEVNEKLTIARGVMLKNQAILRNIEGNIAQTFLEPLRKATLATKALIGAIYSIYDMPSSLANKLTAGSKAAYYNLIASLKREGNPAFREVAIPKNIKREATKKYTNDFLPPEAAEQVTLDFLNDDEKREFNEEVSSVKNSSREFYETLKEENQRIYDNASEAFGLGNEDYNAFTNRLQTFTPGEGRRPSDSESDVLGAFDTIDKALDYMVSTNLPFRNTLEENINQINTVFNKRIPVVIPGSVEEITIPFDTTLEDIASQYFNDPEKWIDIAVLNNLKPPYIQDAPTDPRIKQPGDKLLLPQAEQAVDFDIPVTKDYPITAALTAAEKNLGVDIKLDKNFDLEFSNKGDFKLVAGADNAGQAVIINLTLERGDLKYHTDIGIGLAVGEKMTTVENVADQIREAILKDSRFERITNLSVNIEGNTVKMEVDLKIKWIQQPVPVTLPL